MIPVLFRRDYADTRSQSVNGEFCVGQLKGHKFLVFFPTVNFSNVIFFFLIAFDAAMFLKA